MHRLLVDTASLENETPMLSSEAAAHLKVVRPKSGERIELFDGKGRTREYAVVSSGRSFSLVAAAPAVEFARPPAMTLFACVTKGSRWDWTIEKATELGVTRIVPVVSARTIVRIAAEEREAKRGRWVRVAADAARQSDAKWLPEVLAPMPFAESRALVRGAECFVGALVTPPPAPVAEAVRRRRGELEPAIYVGPEGDFSPEELAELVKIATPVSFGSTILRAETAAIYGVSALKAQLDLSRGAE